MKEFKYAPLVVYFFLLMFISSALVLFNVPTAALKDILLLCSTLFFVAYFLYAQKKFSREKQKLNKNRTKLIEQIAKTVHNLGSPLAAIDMSIQDLILTTNAKTELLHSSLGRIKDITSSLKTIVGAGLEGSTVDRSCLVDEILIKDKVVIVDDDELIYELWKARIGEGVGVSDIKYFSSTVDFIYWYNSNFIKPENYTFLIDNEYSDEEINGMSLINSLSIQKHSYLVTSCYEDKDVLKQCNESNISLVAKNILHIVAVRKLGGLNHDISTDSINVLIDDDVLVHQSWNMSADMKDMVLKSYFTVDEFLNDRIPPSNNLQIFIDSNLGDGKKGEELAIQLTKKGYNNIHITTGYDRSAITVNDSISSVIDKSPPWI